MEYLKPRLIINSVNAIIPGIGPTGQRYGELVSTEELVTHIQPTYPGTSQPINPSWVREYIGVRSVAVTRSNLDLCRLLWSSTPKHTDETAFSLCQGYFNHTIGEMLEHAIHNAALEVLSHKPSAKIVAHVHITTATYGFVEGELYRMRRKSGIPAPAVCTLILQQGCAGLLLALKVADALLGTNADSNNQVLITGDNNMMMTAHLRAQHTAPTNQDYDYWLWPAIFGEGVGAMFVGRPAIRRTDESAAAWRVDSVCIESLCDDQAVVFPLPNKTGGGFKVVLWAKQVRQNYLEGVGKHARLAIKGIGGIDRLHRLCLHESNPLLIKELALRLGIPFDLVPTHSAETGTLACVSAFTVLQDAFQKNGQNGVLHNGDHARKDRIACSLIGEAGGQLLAGHLCLRPANCSDEMACE